jgi:hypothetical protein
MSAVPASRSKGVGAALRLSAFERLAGELKRWRTSDDLKIIEAAKGSAIVFPFVKGLRLSAQLVYMLRTELSDTDLEVDWGHLLDAQEKSCSPECDIIIHRKGHVGRWNGNEHAIMDFRFVRHTEAVAVVSCKSLAKDVDAAYAKKLRPYVRQVLLFAECCAPSKVAHLKQKAKKAGYAGFWPLYTYDENTGEDRNDPDNWQDFLDAVQRTVRKAVRRR